MITVPAGVLTKEKQAKPTLLIKYSVTVKDVKKNKLITLNNNLLWIKAELKQAKRLVRHRESVWSLFVAASFWGGSADRRKCL